MKIKAFLITQKEFVVDNQFVFNEQTDKNSTLMSGLSKKEAIQKFMKKKRVKSWKILQDKNWIIKKVTVKIKDK